MKRTYALKRLLEHGELSFGQICEITGWKQSQVSSALQGLDKSGVIKTLGQYKSYRYALA